MIVDGNYLYLDFEKVKPIFVNVFCKYYGDKYRQEIQNKFDNIEYYGFHDYASIVDYYNEFINKYKEEIIYEFAKISEIKDQNILNEIFSEEAISENMIYIAYEGKENLEEKYTEYGFKKISETRSKLCELLNLDKDNLFEEIDNLKKSLDKAIDIVELKHDCDVFRDVRSIRDSKRKVFQKFLTSLSDIGVSIHVSDGISVGRSDFDDNSICNLDCFGIYFDDEFLNSGVVGSFLDKYDKDANFRDRLRNIYNRIYFLDYSNVPLKYIDDLSKIDESHAGLALLEKEYEYQKQHFSDIHTFICDDREKWKKDWEKGDFIPKHIAENIEYIRNECQEELLSKVKNFDFYKRNIYETGIDFFTSYSFDIKNGMKPCYRVYINEGVNCKEYTLSSIIHELNHVIGFYPINISEHLVDCKEGISFLTFEYLNKFEDKKGDWDFEEDEYLQIFQENINQRLTKEIYDIFIGMHSNPYNNIKNQKMAVCEYEDYDFITEEFYKANRRLLKQNVVEKTSRNLFYDSEGFYEKKGPLGALKRKIGSIYNKHKEENRYKYSVNDLRKIGKLIAYFEKELLYFIAVNDLSQEDIENGNYIEMLPPEECERLDSLIKERDRLNNILLKNKKNSENPDRNL